VTQAMVDAGGVVNTASVRAVPPGGVPVEETSTSVVSVLTIADIDIDKQAPAAALWPGDVVEYVFVVTNPGTVTIFDPVVTDPLLTVDCPAVTSLAPGESLICRGNYLVTLDDSERGFVRNTATVEGIGPAGQLVSDTDVVQSRTRTPSTGLEYPGPFTLPTPEPLPEVPAPLALTGNNSQRGLTLAIALLGAGGAVVVAVRRRDQE